MVVDRIEGHQLILARLPSPQTFHAFEPWRYTLRTLAFCS